MASVQWRHTCSISESSGYHVEIRPTVGNMPSRTGHQLPVGHEQEEPLALLETCVIAVLRDKAPSMTGNYERYRGS